MEVAGPGDGRPQYWVSGEYLLWWARGMNIPPLVTASPPGTPRALAGVLGAPGTQVLFGGTRVNEGPVSGGRLQVGAWLDCDASLGVEADGFLLESQSASSTAASDGSQIISRPFFGVRAPVATSELVSFPGVLAGSVRATAETGNVVGAAARLRYNLSDCRAEDRHVHLLAGYRFLRLRDELRVREDLTPLDRPGSGFDLEDRFATRNEFHGVDLGVAAGACGERWSVEGLARVALGGLHRTVDITGSTLIQAPGLAAPFPGGLLALPSNIGTYTDRRFAVVPEVGLKAGWRLTENCGLMLGYTLLWLPGVARAGDQVDLTVNQALIPPAVAPVTPGSRPAFRMESDDSWLQGLSLGIDIQF